MKKRTSRKHCICVQSNFASTIGLKNLADLLRCHDTGPAVCVASWKDSVESKVLRKHRPDPGAEEPVQN